MQLCGSLSILWHCLSLGLEWKLTFSSPVATAEFSKFAGHKSWISHSCVILFLSLWPEPSNLLLTKRIPQNWSGLGYKRINFFIDSWLYCFLFLNTLMKQAAMLERLKERNWGSPPNKCQWETKALNPQPPKNWVLSITTWTWSWILSSRALGPGPTLIPLLLETMKQKPC